MARHVGVQGMSAVNPLPQSETAEPRHEPSMEEILASIRRIIADDQSLPGRLPARDAEAAASPPEVPRDAPFAAGLPTPMARREPEPEHVAVPPELAHLSVTQAPREVGLVHGPISAPQFAMPHGPVGDDAISEPSLAEPPVADLSLDKPAAHDALRPPHIEAHASTPPPDEPDPVSPEPEAVLELEAEPIHTFEPAHLAPEERFPAQGVPHDAPPLFSTATNSAVSEAFNMLAASRLADNSDDLMDLAREMIRPLLRTWIDDNLPGMVERMIRAEIERVARGGR